MQVLTSTPCKEEERAGFQLVQELECAISEQLSSPELHHDTRQCSLDVIVKHSVVDFCDQVSVQQASYFFLTLYCAETVKINNSRNWSTTHT